MQFHPLIDNLVHRVREFWPRFEVTWCDPDTAALGYQVRYQAPWQSHIVTRQMGESSLALWLEALVMGEQIMAYTHLRSHAEEPAAIGTDGATLVVTNEEGLREDLRMAYFRRFEASPWPTDGSPLPAVYDLGTHMLGIGRYGVSDCPEAIVICTDSDGGYGVRMEWDLRFDAEHGEVSTGERVVIDIHPKLTRAEWDAIDLDVAQILARQEDPATEEDKTPEDDDA